MKDAVELKQIEKALLILAEHIERCPFNDYKVRQEVLDALGLEFIPDTKPQK